MSATYIPLEQLPIDQFSRQQWASLMIEQFRNSQNAHFKILDVGGYQGRTADFQARDEVFVCDLFDVKEKNYIKGDGRNLPFADNDFDFVVTFDTYEHIPRKDREKFLCELTRAAKFGVVLAAPFDEVENGPVSQAEASLNDYHKQVYGFDHIWLKEHIDYQTPRVKEIEEILGSYKMFFASLKSNDLDLWIITQYIYFSIQIDSEFMGRVDDLNRMYSQHFMDLDKVDELSYRRVYFISQQKSNVSKIRNFLVNQPSQNRLAKLQYTTFAINLLGRKYADAAKYVKYLEDEINKFKNQLSSSERRR